MDPAEVGKAPPHHAVKHVESQLLGAWRVAPHAVHHAGKPTASPEKTKSNLRVFQFADRIQEVTSFGSSLWGVRLDEGILPDSSAEKFKVPQDFAGAISAVEEGVGKGPIQGGHSALMEHDHFALSQVEVQTECSHSAAAPAQRPARQQGRQQAIVQVVNSDV